MYIFLYSILGVTWDNISVQIFCFGCWTYCYIVVLAAASTGRRTKLLYYLNQRHSMSIHEITSLYNAKEMLKIRIQRLEDNKSVIKRGNDIYLMRRNHLSLLAYILLIINRVLFGSHNEYDKILKKLT